MYRDKDLEGYFGWLVKKVGVDFSDTKKLDFLWQLFTIDFYYTVGNDVNRLRDGLTLRDEYLEEDGRWGVPVHNCSVLEMLIGFSDRLAKHVLGDYSSDGEVTVEWFWRFIRNLGITNAKGDIILSKGDICTVIERWLHRDFSYYGHGSPFPLDENSPVEDQRDVEIWQQFCIYLAENPWLEG